MTLSVMLHMRAHTDKAQDQLISLDTEQDVHHFVYDILKYILLYENI